MTKDTKTTIVIFRKFKDGDIIAIFPELNGTNDLFTMSSYMHVGQHGSCDDSLMYKTKPATADEYQPLYNELESIGYNLEIRRKLTYKHYLARKAALDQIKRDGNVLKI